MSTALTDFEYPEPQFGGTSWIFPYRAAISAHQDICRSLVKKDRRAAMNPLQEKHERWVGDQVIDWYNARHGTHFRFNGRCGVAPDLEYRDRSRLLRIEVVTAYYDKADAKFCWLHAKKHPDAPHKWSGVNFEKNLVENINSAIDDKFQKTYGPNCLLAVCVLPSLTFADEMEPLLASITIPAANPSTGVYLCGQFPAPIPNLAETKVWQLA